MGRVYDEITDELVRWPEARPVFFVATAPSDPDTHVNVSPRSRDTFRVLYPEDDRYLVERDEVSSHFEVVARVPRPGD